MVDQRMVCDRSSSILIRLVNMEEPQGLLGSMPARPCSLLGVSRATLYAYVSRGRIRSEAVPGSARRSRYARDDIERLVARTRERRNPEKAAEQALHWGLPILESAITLIADQRIYYRGRDARRARALERARRRRGVALDAAPPTAARSRRRKRAAAARRATRPSPPFVAAAQSALALAAAADPLAFDLRPRAVAQTGWRILWLLDAGSRPAATAPQATDRRDVGGRLGRAARRSNQLRAALILCADHELNVSAFTARCVASAGGSPYGVVIAGLGRARGHEARRCDGRLNLLLEQASIS